jgi:hypothetical protein
MRKLSWLILGVVLVLCMATVVKQTNSIYILDPTTSDPAIKIRFANGHASSVIEIADTVGNNKFTLGTNGILGAAYGGTGVAGTDGTYLGVNGTASAVTFGFSNDPDTGMFRSATNAIGFSTGGTERWVINSSGALNPVADNVYDIGNGSVNPRDITVSRNVLIKGGATITGTGTVGTVSSLISKATGASSKNVGANFVASGATSNSAIQTDTDTAAGTDNWAIESLSPAQSSLTGSLGIGYYRPAQQLDVAGNIASSSIGLFTNGVASYRSNTIAPAAFTFPATTVNWTNPLSVNIQVYIDNSGVTGTSIKKNGGQIFQLMTGPATIGLQPGEYFSETYSVGTPVGTYSPF